MPAPLPKSTRSSVFIVIGLAAALVGGGWWWFQRGEHADAPPQSQEAADRNHRERLEKSEENGVEDITFPRESWEAAGIALRPATPQPFEESIELTGKIALNEDGVAHIFPLVDGRVDEVRVQFGQKVKKGDVLVVVQSKEVGQSMLQLFQNRLLLQFALIKDQWTQAATANTQSMLGLMRDGAKFEEIEKQLHNRPMGDYRERLMSAYIAHYRSQAHVERLSPLSQEGVVPGKQMLEAQSDANAARATLQSLLEQIQQDLKQASALSTQNVKELQTRIAVDETNLKILGFHGEELADIDPQRLGEAIAHYPVYAPFDGTVISKDVVLLERVGPERQILSIADLSTVWVTTDIYEEHLPLLKQLAEQKIYMRSNAWPGKRFEARIFYTGDVVNETTRTISMRAAANNSEGLLKPGMFVNVEFPSVSRNDVLQVPLSALQDHEGRSFVFVHTGGEQFYRRDVTLGRRNSQAVEILSGVETGESIVTAGGFALKSKMLADLLAE